MTEVCNHSKVLKQDQEYNKIFKQERLPSGVTCVKKINNLDLFELTLVGGTIIHVNKHVCPFHRESWNDYNRFKPPGKSADFTTLVAKLEQCAQLFMSL